MNESTKKKKSKKRKKTSVVGEEEEDICGLTSGAFLQKLQAKNSSTRLSDRLSLEFSVFQLSSFVSFVGPCSDMENWTSLGYSCVIHS